MKEVQPVSAVARTGVLNGKTILVTRPHEQAVEFTEYLHSHGAHVVVFPTIRITEPASWNECDVAIGRIDSFDTIIFTSANAVDFFLQRYSSLNTKSLAGKKIYAVGTKTQEAVAQFGLSADVIGSHFTGKDLAEALKTTIDRNAAILFPHGNLGRNELSGCLREFGVTIEEVIVYRTIEPDQQDIENARAYIEKNSVDVYTFFSPSSIENLLKIVSREIVARSIVAVIGTTTAHAAQTAGLPVHIIPEQSTAKDLALAIVSYFEHLSKEKPYDASE